MGIKISQLIHQNLEIQDILAHHYFQDQDWLDLKQRKQLQKMLKYRDWTQLHQLNFRKCQLNMVNLRTITQMHWPNLIKLDLGTQNIIQQYEQWVIILAVMEQSCYVKLTYQRYNIYSYVQKYHKYTDKCNMGRQGRHLVKGNWSMQKTLDKKQNNVGLDGYQSMYCITSKFINYIGIAENNAVGALILFAATNWHPQQQSSTYIQICHIGNPTLYRTLMHIYSTRLNKPQWMI